MEVKSVPARVDYADYLIAGCKLKKDDIVLHGNEECKFISEVDELHVVVRNKLDNRVINGADNLKVVRINELQVVTDVVITSTIDFKHVIQRDLFNTKENG